MCVCETEALATRMSERESRSSDENVKFTDVKSATQSHHLLTRGLLEVLIRPNKFNFPLTGGTSNALAHSQSLQQWSYCHLISPFHFMLRGIVVSAFAWHSLGREIESCPRVRECFPLNMP